MMLDKIRLFNWRLGIRITDFILAKKYNFSSDDIPVSQPYLLISNHATDADPFLIGTCSKDYPPAFVASEHLNRLGLLSKFINFQRLIIPIKKASLSVSAVKDIYRTIKDGRAVVLFAEGDTTWNGVSAEIFPATGKLVKLAKVPLVTYRIEGGYFSKPRWAKNRRKGKMQGKVVRVYEPSEIKEMSPAEIDSAINRDIFFDAVKNALENDVCFKSGAHAEGLEKAVFVCPECKAVGTLRTKKNDIICSSCGMKASLDGYGRITGIKQDVQIENIYLWDMWQQENLYDLLEQSEKESFFECRGRLLNLSDKVAKPEKCDVCLKKEAIIAGNKCFAFSEISEMAMVQTRRLLFTAHEGYFEIFSKNAVLRPYLLAWQAWKRKQEIKT